MGKILPASRNLKQLTKQEIADSIPYPKGSPTPSEMTPEDCCYPGAPRPCPLVTCKFNNYLNVTDNGTILLTWPDKQPEDVNPEHSCVLDVADQGQDALNPLTLDEIGDIVGMTRQAIDLQVIRAQANFKKAWKERKKNGQKDDGSDR